MLCSGIQNQMREACKDDGEWELKLGVVKLGAIAMGLAVEVMQTRKAKKKECTKIPLWIKT